MAGARATALSLAVAATSAAGAAHASPEDVFGFGPRTMALGAAGPAIAEGFEAVHANPALLSASRERSLHLGFAGAVFDLRAAERLSYEAMRGSFIGATLPIPLGGALEDRIALGLGFFTPFGLVVRGRILYPETPQFPIADRTQSVAVQAGIGVDVGWGIRIGGGFAALAALEGSVLVGTDASGRIGTVVEDTLVASYGPIVGASFERGAYRFGATFRGSLEARFNVVITVRDLAEIVVPPLHISGVAQYDPTQVAAEFARVRGPWRVAVGATYKRWSDYPGPVEATVRCPIGTNLVTEECGASKPASVDYSDTVVPRIGVERALPLSRAATAYLRGGYFFEPSPAPEQTKDANLYDNSRSAFTVGYGLGLAAPLPPIDLDVFGQVHLLHARTHEKDDSVAAENPGAPSVETSGWILAGGMTAAVRF